MYASIIRWPLCNMALVNGGDAGLSEGTKRAKITITKKEGMKIIGHGRIPSTDH